MTSDARQISLIPPIPANLLQKEESSQKRTLQNPPTPAPKRVCRRTIDEAVWNCFVFQALNTKLDEIPQLQALCATILAKSPPNVNIREQLILKFHDDYIRGIDTNPYLARMYKECEELSKTYQNPAAFEKLSAQERFLVLSQREHVLRDPELLDVCRKLIDMGTDPRILHMVTLQKFKQDLDIGAPVPSILYSLWHRAQRKKPITVRFPQSKIMHWAYMIGKSPEGKQMATCECCAYPPLTSILRSNLTSMKLRPNQHGLLGTNPSKGHGIQHYRNVLETHAKSRLHKWSWLRYKVLNLQWKPNRVLERKMREERLLPPKASAPPLTAEEMKSSEDFDQDFISWTSVMGKEGGQIEKNVWRRFLAACDDKIIEADPDCVEYFKELSIPSGLERLKYCIEYYHNANPYHKPIPMLLTKFYREAGGPNLGRQQYSLPTKKKRKQRLVAPNGVHNYNSSASVAQCHTKNPLRAARTNHRPPKPAAHYHPLPRTKSKSDYVESPTYSSTQMKLNLPLPNHHNHINTPNKPHRLNHSEIEDTQARARKSTAATARQRTAMPYVPSPVKPPKRAQPPQPKTNSAPPPIPPPEITFTNKIATTNVRAVPALQPVPNLIPVEKNPPPPKQKTPAPTGRPRRLIKPRQRYEPETKRWTPSKKPKEVKEKKAEKKPAKKKAKQAKTKVKVQVHTPLLDSEPVKLNTKATPEHREFHVEKILSRRKKKGRMQWLVKWAAYDKPTWEPKTNLQENKIWIAYERKVGPFNKVRFGRGMTPSVSKSRSPSPEMFGCPRAPEIDRERPLHFPKELRESTLVIKSMTDRKIQFRAENGSLWRFDAPGTLQYTKIRPAGADSDSDSDSDEPSRRITPTFSRPPVNHKMGSGKPRKTLSNEEMRRHWQIIQAGAIPEYDVLYGKNFKVILRDLKTNGSHCV